MAARRGSRRGPTSRGGDRATANTPDRRAWFWALALVVIGAIVYTNAWSGPFVFDDRATVLDNTQIRDLADLPRVFSPPTETPVAGRPLANATFAFNYAVGAFDVTGYHGVNLVLHVVCAVLLFLLVRRALEDDLPAFAAALVWLVHPLNTEAVDYISQRTETLMAAALLFTLYASARARAPLDRARWSITAVVACAAGMASKETMVVAPVLVVLYDRAFGFPTFAAAWRERWRLYAALAVTWVVLAALQLTHPRSQSAGFSAPDAAPWTYLLNQSRMIARYLRLVVWPHPLVLFYGPPQPLALADVWPYFVGVSMLLGLVAWAWWRWPRLGFLGAWFFLTLAPASSLVPIATEVGAERRMYVPLMALGVAGVVAAVAFGRRVRLAPSAARLTGVAGLAVMVLALGARTLARNGDYASSLRLAETTAAGWPTPAAESMLGTELAAAGRLPDAEAALTRAAETYEPARYYLGTVLAAEQKTDAAIAVFERYFRTALPALVEVRKARGMLGDLYGRGGRWTDAIGQYRAILARDPNDLAAHGALADAFMSTQAFGDAIPHYEALLAARSDDVRALGGLGIAFAQTGRLDEAISAFQRAVDVNPRNAHAQQNLARALLGAGRRDEARAHARQAEALDPSDRVTQQLLAEIRE